MGISHSFWVLAQEIGNWLKCIGPKGKGLFISPGEKPSNFFCVFEEVIQSFEASIRQRLKINKWCVTNSTSPSPQPAPGEEDSISSGWELEEQNWNTTVCTYWNTNTYWNTLKDICQVSTLISFIWYFDVSTYVYRLNMWLMHYWCMVSTWTPSLNKQCISLFLWMCEIRYELFYEYIWTQSPVNKALLFYELHLHVPFL